MITSVFKFFYGSTPDDFEMASDEHPFDPCPESPNCTIYSVEFSKPISEIWIAVKSAIQNLSPHKTEMDSETYELEAVFRIAVFGFLDDVKISLREADDDRSILYIKSSSRVGHSDLGVNRRRIKKIVSAINQQLT